MHDMKQQRPECLICSKFYFQITIKGIQVLFRVIYEIMHDVNRKSPKERNIPDASNKWPEGTQKQTPELSYHSWCLDLYPCLFLSFQHKIKCNAEKQKSTIQEKRNLPMGYTFGVVTVFLLRFTEKCSKQGIVSHRNTYFET